MEKIRCVNCMEEITGSVCPHCGYKEGDTEQTGYGLKRNSILHGRYLIGNVLGQGGFGITYIGFDLALELKVAIKEYFPMGYVSRDYTQSNQIVWNTMRDGQEQWKKGSESFLKEARRMAKIDVLPEIVRVRDTFMENNTSYIVMDYVEGQTLKSWLLKNGTMKFSECIRMFLPLMNSLNEVHAFGLIHRDISPDNIMVLPNGKVRLLDLGAAKDLSIESNGTSQLVTKKGFSPVEQYMESGVIGTWTDVYALCATIYYCITGKMVPEAMERLAMERMMGNTLKLDVPLREALSEEAVKTLQYGLAIRSEDRIQTVEELEKRLQKAVQFGEETEKKTKNEPERKQEEKAASASDTITDQETSIETEKKMILAAAMNGDSNAQFRLGCLYYTSKDYNNARSMFLQSAEKGNPNAQNSLGKMYEDSLDVEAAMKWYKKAADNGNKDGAANYDRLGQKLQKAVTTKDNILMMNSDQTVLGREISRASIASITFVNTLDKMADNAWDVSEKKDGSVMAWTVKNNDMYDLYIGGDGGVIGSDCSGLFSYYSNVQKIDFNNCFDTSQVKNMVDMFYSCKKLTELDVNCFDTSHVANMARMFAYCEKITELDVSGFDISRVKDISGMFYSCKKLTKLDVSNFNTSNVTNMSDMFLDCEKLTKLDVSGFDTSNVTDISYMFANCKELTELNVSSFDTSNVTDISYMFVNCKKLTKLDVSGFNTSNVTNMEGMFGYCGITAKKAGLKTN